MKTKEQIELEKALHKLKVSLLEPDFIKSLACVYAGVLIAIFSLWIGGGLK